MPVWPLYGSDRGDSESRYRVIASTSIITKRFEDLSDYEWHMLNLNKEDPSLGFKTLSIVEMGGDFVLTYERDFQELSFPREPTH